MDVTSTAAAAISLQGNMQIALAGLKQTAEAEQAVVGLLAQSTSAQSLPTPPAGRGTMVDFLA